MKADLYHDGRRQNAPAGRQLEETSSCPASMYGGARGGTLLTTALSWSVATVLVLVAASVIVVALPVLRVGDGMEYYALFHAWTETLRPWMSDASFAAYQRLHESGSVAGTLPRQLLQDGFPYLRVVNTADFNHFWFYSLLAALVHAPLEWLGAPLNAHQSFVALHAICFVGLLALASCLHGWKGFTVVLLLTASSPMIWYINKVHTEFFTFCVTLAAIVLTARNYLVAGALLMALAATQNPGISFVAVAMIGIRGLGDWKTPYSRWEVAGVSLTLLILALHPTYYFFRYGVITPQLLAGGAAPGAGLSTAYIWLIDPDVGLFPNWAFGLVLLLAGIVLWRKAYRSVSEEKRFIRNPTYLWTVCAVFLMAALYSHASTQNLNSGATPGLSRYALWYIPLVYPFALSCVVAASHLGLIGRSLTGALAIAFTFLGLGVNITTVHETSHIPSSVSYFIQRHLPAVYDPPAEIFAERYSGLGEQPVKAVVGPDCHKTLIFPQQMPGEAVTVPAACSFSVDRIEMWTSARSAELNAPGYFTISSESIDAPRQIIPGTSYPHYTDDNTVRFVNWSGPEATHRWSAGDESRILLQLPPATVDRCLALNGFTFGQQKITAYVGEKLASETSLQGQGTVIVPLGRAEGTSEVTLRFSNPIVPSDTDSRLLAFAVETLSVVSCG